MIVDLATYTTIHTALSLVALASGIILVIGLIGSKPLPAWNALFLVTAVATSASMSVNPRMAARRRRAPEAVADRAGARCIIAAFAADARS